MYLINCVRRYKLRGAIDSLIELLRGNDKDVQKAAGVTLKLLTGEGLAPEYDLWQEWREKNR